MRWTRLQDWSRLRLDELRLHLSRPETLLPLALLGLLAGLLSGGVILLFRVLVEGSQDAFLPGAGPENYEALPAWLRLLLPLAGGLLLAAMFIWGSRGMHVLGIASVIERMQHHQGYLSLRGLCLQFVGAAVAIASGHSVGREGPHVYLGAAASSLMGQQLRLPNNSVRTLVGCGAAAGIAASFNTPLAGVVFAVEVIMMEYTVASFIPVILAAVSANALSVAVLGAEPAFSMPAMPPFSLGEIPMVVALGLVTGGLAALYVHLLQTVALRSQKINIAWRMLLAGALAGLLGLLAPQVMGIGYDTVNAALLGQLGAWTLLTVVAAKLLATTVCIGLGVPGGSIGPMLFLGAMLGSLVGVLSAQWLPVAPASSSLFALLGMGAMMGASLQAPLAALTAIMELTQSPGVVMPGMLAIVVASLTASEVFGKRSLFLAMLESTGRNYDASPLMLALRRIGVASVMNKRFVRVDPTLSRAQAESIVDTDTDWIIIEQDDQPSQLLSGNELARYLRDHADDPAPLDLLEIPAERLQPAGISVLASLYEAHQLLEQSDVEALVVFRHFRGRGEHVYGILTPELVESSYRLPDLR